MERFAVGNIEEMRKVELPSFYILISNIAEDNKRQKKEAEKKQRQRRLKSTRRR